MISKNSSLNIKALAIIMVLVGHLIGVNKLSVPIPFIDIATFGVSLFLFISGYGLVKSYESNGLKNFFIKKIKSVYMPFAIATVLVGMAKGYFSDRWFEIIKTILFINPKLPIDGTMWYIYFIAVWYILFYVSFRFLSNNLLRILFLSVSSVLIYKIPFSQSYDVASFLFSFHAFTFTLGVAVAMCGEYKKELMLALGCMCMVVFLYLFYLHFLSYDPLNHVMASLISAPAIIFIVSYFDVKIKILSFIGGISYEVYLFEGVLRRIDYTSNEITNCLMFFLIVGCIAFSFKSFIKNYIK
ncbi:TPA: acyltransferase family protein [Yersinia enterocolitica]|uniref:acyltransferase family protein n=1 Tax=Yersinia enterocolitica TaxID=630 RepID=UPI0028B8C577|nr:acyltransferase family protein [Yersinia enterocolitica]ELI7910307.1 acyltransferase family protein [Yersinia enterocolitica]ELW8171210.1 acyltransferase family protein [Yersinia enterocolitica]HDL6772125.1 acyltransferase family protein [Yersinia enterocolitica]HDL7206348.1 acyltransferase family protein [Yersinia enterocolitica]